MRKRGETRQEDFLTHKRIIFFLFCYIRNGRYAVKLKSSGSVAGGTDLSLASHGL